MTLPRARNAARWAWWLTPVVFLVWLYREGFTTWFIADDFAWLVLPRLVHLHHDLLYEMFAPMAQGTIRPWSERGYFFLLESLFGFDSLPFRIVAFATAATVAMLLAWVTVRATGSRVAGFVAPFLWIANTALVRAITWSSAYNELMCPLFLLGALVLLIRYTETGARRFWWWQLVVFILGFGALEINIVYPALAAVWLLCMRRFSWRHVLPQTAISVGYFVIHRLVAPLPTSGAYALVFDNSILKTAALYWKWSLTPQQMESYGNSHRAAELVLVAGTLAIAAYTIHELQNRRYTVLFYLAWFAITLAPLLPLPAHRTDYYLTIPVIGLAMLGGAAAGQFLNQPIPQTILAVIPLAAYLWAMIPVTQHVTHWWRQNTQAVRTLVLGVAAARQTHPEKAIVVNGISAELYDFSFAHSPFAAMGIEGVYLMPKSGLTIPSGPELVDPGPLVPDPSALSHGITHDEVVVYSLESDHLRNITEGYARQVAGRIVDRLPARVDVGNSLYSWLLGPAWLAPERGIRWMPGSATVRIGVPEWGHRLELKGRCPSAQLSVAPRHLMILVDGTVAGDTRIYDPERSFQRLFPLPELAAGKKSVEVEIRVDPVDRMDGQDYGLVFGEIAIRP